MLDSRCGSGYLNPESGSCVSRGEARWIQGVILPNSSTAGRNTLHTGGANNFDLNLSRSFSISMGSAIALAGT